jgi:hypothetical protein
VLVGFPMNPASPLSMMTKAFAIPGCCAWRFRQPLFR